MMEMMQNERLSMTKGEMIKSFGYLMVSPTPVIYMENKEERKLKVSSKMA